MSMKDVAKNSTTVIFLSFVATILGYLLRLFLARNLSISDYGLFYAVLAFVGFFATFRDPGLSTALVKMVPEFMAKGDFGRIKTSAFFVLSVQLAIGLLIVVPMIVFSEWLAANYFGTTAAAIPLQIISLSFMVSVVMSLLQSVFQGMKKMFYFALVEPLRLSSVFVVSALLIGLGVSGPSYGYLAASIIVTATLFLLLARTSPIFNAKMEADKHLFKKLFLFGLPLFAGGLGSIAINYADTIVLTVSRSLYEVGLYQAALPTSQLLWFFVGGISSVLLPTVSSLWSEGKKNEVSDGILILAKVIFMAITPVVIVFVAFPEIILRMLFGELFMAAAQSLQILSVGAIFYTFYLIFVTVLIAVGKPVLYTKMWLGVGLASVALNLIMTPVVGISGAALSMSASYALGLAVSVIYLRKLMVVKFPLQGMLKAFLGGFIVMMLIFFLKTSIEADPVAELAVLGVVSAVTYTAFSIRFIVNKNDLRMLSAIGIKLPRFISSRLEKILR